LVEKLAGMMVGRKVDLLEQMRAEPMEPMKAGLMVAMTAVKAAVK
jgi:hypothetical protein